MTYDIPIRLATGKTETVLIDIADERVAQVAKWGVQSWPTGTGGAHYEAARDASQAHTDEAAQRGDVTWTDILLEEVFEALAEADPVKLREELVQVAAVAVSIVEDIDRKATREETLRAFRESEMVGQAIAEGRLPLRSPGAAS